MTGDAVLLGGPLGLGHEMMARCCADLLEGAPKAFQRGVGNPYSCVADDNLQKLRAGSDGNDDFAAWD